MDASYLGGGPQGCSTPPLNTHWAHTKIGPHGVFNGVYSELVKPRSLDGAPCAASTARTCGAAQTT